MAKKVKDDERPEIQEEADAEAVFQAEHGEPVTVDAAVDPDVVPSAVAVLRVEDEGVSPYLEIPLTSDPGKAHTVDLGPLGRFHHVSDGPDGVWVYRRVPA